MICENCGANIKNRESFCPNCGMELMTPYSKSIKAKYIAGEYTEDQDRHTDHNTYIENQDHKANQDYKENRESYVPKNRRNARKEKPTEEIDVPAQEQYEEDVEEYNESGVSILTVIILFLIVALLIGFVIGILVFSGFLHSLPGFSNL